MGYISTVANRFPHTNHQTPSRAEFRLLRLTTFIGFLEKHIAADEEALLPVEELTKAAVDEQLEEPRIHQINKVIADSRIPYPQATVAEIEYPEGREINA